ncbi:MAG: transglutaminase domain-containing protein [Anaerolineales bacterium]|nr:transglutaminase domain-containing protein [Anaerolineales bacterium]
MWKKPKANHLQNHPMAAERLLDYQTALCSGLLLLAAACDVPAENPSPDTAAPLAAASPTATTTLPYSIREQTLYEGEVVYTCDADGCWREGGNIAGPPDYFYPDIDRQNEEIGRLLADLGLPTQDTADDREAWRRIRRVWAWLEENGDFIGDPGHQEAWAYLVRLSPENAWVSIGDMAKAYAHFGKLPMEACNSKAFTFVTLLYRSGIPPGRVSAATGLVHNSGHVYAVVRVEGRWRVLDPSCLLHHPQLSEDPESVGCVDGMDYAHPTQLEPLPGSHFPSPMLAE